LPQNEDGTTNVEFLFTAKNATATTTYKVIAKINPPPPTASISITPSGTIPYDGQYTVNWSSTLGTSVSSSSNLNNTTSLSGSLTVTNAKESKTHSITVRNTTGTTTASVTANVAACVPTTIETDSAVYTYSKVVYSNGTESKFDYYLTLIKDNTVTNAIVEYPNRTSEYSTHKLKTVIYTIASAFKNRIGRPPTPTEVSQWLGIYNKGISLPYSFTFNVSRSSSVSGKTLFSNSVRSGASFGSYSFEIPAIPASDFSLSGNDFYAKYPSLDVGYISGTNQGYTFHRTILVTSLYETRIFINDNMSSFSVSAKSLNYKSGNDSYVVTLTDSRPNGLVPTACFFAGASSSICNFVIPVSSLTGLTDNILSLLFNYPTLSISRLVSTCGTTIPQFNNPGT